MAPKMIGNERTGDFIFMTWQEFEQQFSIQLNEQQKSAVQSVDGPVLLLAVPGSGKTTVLVTRLGYMIYCKGMDPGKILTVTYTVAATKDMAERFAAKFGQEMAERLEFRTINGICARVIQYYSWKTGRTAFQLLTDEKRITAMLAGIYLDTKGFSTRTGVRTFEAAAYLRRAGAESSDVKRLFQSSFDQYMERQKLISSARDCGQGVIFAITGEEVDRIAAAQAADELLSIIGTHASVVAFRSGNDMAVSARAAGHVNVQLLMERLGGGGNHSAAGAQLKNTTPEEADKLITDAIRGYFDDQRTEKQDDNK